MVDGVITQNGVHVQKLVVVARNPKIVLALILLHFMVVEIVLVLLLITETVVLMHVQVRPLNLRAGVQHPSRRKS